MTKFSFALFKTLVTVLSTSGDAYKCLQDPRYTVGSNRTKLRKA